MYKPFWQLIVAGVLGLSIFAPEVLAQENKNSGRKVRIVGKLRYGVVAIGGETTGVEISVKRTRYELAFRSKPKLKSQAKKLNGKVVTVTGTLRKVKGVEISVRWILQVTNIKAGGGRPRLQYLPPSSGSHRLIQFH
ncbi:MAG: hypothetical protein ACFCD0_29330 [Gemmataceae bacterium]